MNYAYNEFSINKKENNVTKTLTKKLSNNKILSCIILKDSQIIFDYYQNEKISHSVQKINSCTKSITSALIGICLDKGLINDIHIPITEYFGDIIMKDSDPRKRDITLYHLLTMSAGFDWPEFGEWNCFAPMVYSNDIITFILNRNLLLTPGERMNYNSGCSHLLGSIIQKATGFKISEFANDVLFRPLGITDYKWYESNNQCLTADGLRLKTIDMLKFGYLYLNGGIYKKKYILSSNWITDSTQPLFHTYDGIGSYGYQWWVSSIKSEDQSDIHFYFALGYMGQYIIVVPKYEIIIAVTSRLDNTMVPLNLLKDMIVDIANA